MSESGRSLGREEFRQAPRAAHPKRKSENARIRPSRIGDASEEEKTLPDLSAELPPKTLSP